VAAHAYLALAGALLAPPPPRLVAIGGLAGTGKSTLARRLAPDIGAVPGALIVRSDVVRKSLFGVAPTVRLDQSAYAPEVSRRVYDQIADRARQALEAGHSVIADAVFGDVHEREAIAQVARQTGVPFTGVWLEAPFDVAASRIRRRKDDASDATVAVLEQQQARSPGAIDWISLDASTDVDALARQAVTALGGHGVREAHE
jgi:predicted kinase